MIKCVTCLYPSLIIQSIHPVTFRKPIFSRPFRILMVCFFFNRLGASLIWPFITLFIREQTGAPLATITVLLTLQALATIFGTAIASAVMDRIGRKLPMIVGLAVLAVVLLMMSQAETLLLWAVLIGLYGILQPLFFIGTQAMVADLFADPADRTRAYALVRTISNVAIALGPAIGGLFIAQSRLFAYVIPAVINLLLVIPFASWVVESLPLHARGKQGSGLLNIGYLPVMRDRAFMSFWSVFALVEIAAAMVFTLLAVYTKENFGLAENQFGLLLTVNAGMVVLLQVFVTRQTARYAPYPVLALGALFYTIGLIGFGLSTALPHFLLSMVIMTIGELLVAPTSSALVASLAPEDKRARYMGMLALSYTVGAGIGPVIGGIVSAQFAPSAIWYFGASAAFAAALGFTLLAYPRSARYREKPSG